MSQKKPLVYNRFSLYSSTAAMAIAVIAVPIAVGVKQMDGHDAAAQLF